VFGCAAPGFAGFSAFLADCEHSAAWGRDLDGSFLCFIVLCSEEGCWVGDDMTGGELG
jgi:hypothetical protein